MNTRYSETFRPTSAEVQQELKRVQNHRKYVQTLRSTVYVLVIVAAFAVLAATLWMPVLEIHGSSMTPGLHEGDLVTSIKSSHFETGDVIAFYFNNKILVKRVIAGPGDWVDIRSDGTVLVNGEYLQEPYLEELALGETDIELPYQVPDGRWFVMGDHRSTSVDSRSKSIGSVAEEQVVGRLMYRVWPLKSMGRID